MSQRKNWLRLGLFVLLLCLTLIGAKNKGCLGWRAPYEKPETITGSSGIPITPSDLVATVVSYKQINLTWADNSTIEDGFVIEYKTEASAGYVQVATVGPDATGYSHKGLTELTNYYYRVYAYNATGNSDYSNPVLISTTERPSLNRPLSPSDLIAEILSSSEIKLTWNDRSSNEDGFKIERRMYAAGYSEIATVETNVVLYIDLGVISNTTYFYRVIAYNALGESRYYTNEVSITTPQSDSWDSILDLFTNAPLKRDNHTAVWTGNEMIVWGGYNINDYLNTGGRYDPASDTWSAITTNNAPTARYYHKAVWTGSEMVVWGGQNQFGDPINTGGILNPVLDTWTATSIPDAPTGRYLHTMIWTGDKTIVWSGIDFWGRTNTGGVYDPTANSWDTINYPNLVTGVDAPSARDNHTAVWTGSRMIVWGGNDGTFVLNTGGIYDPASDTWSAITTDNAPAARYYHKAVWTGSKMIIWGGDVDGAYTNTGGIYDPSANTWSTITIGGDAPSGRYMHSMAWSDSTNKMIVWGGYDDTHSNTGGMYDPDLNNWTTINPNNAPKGRSKHSAIWDDSASRMIVWGGSDTENYFNNGGTFVPTTNTWSLISGSNVPSTRSNHTAVWNDSTSQMIIWGGNIDGAYTNTGSIYDLATDYWEPLATTGAPSSRTNHTAVWTGSGNLNWRNNMIIWGGYNGVTRTNTGGLYNYLDNTWSNMTILEAPSERERHTVVWTGEKMIMWGGYDGTDYFNGGKIYDPSLNAWTAITSTNAPASRTNHTAVWTGSGSETWRDRMIIWGGYDGTNYLNTGAIYDPVSDTWTSIATAYAPTSRANHSAVWTGEKMLVWGGNDNSAYFNTGIIYDPQTNAWTANITVADAPTERANHTAVWTGYRMMVWGGYDGLSALNTGGIYDVTSNLWQAITTTDAPVERRFHSAIWSGLKLIIWGGKNGTYLNTGGKYQQ